MDYDIEFLPVGDGTKAGDAIVVSYVTTRGHEVIVVDGGTQESGEAMVEHIRTHFGQAIISHVVNSHPDADHASGLRPILENFKVENLWIHQPWLHSAAIRPLLKDARWTVDGISRTLQEEYPVIVELVTTAAAQGTAVAEPFQGGWIGPFLILSPTVHAYQCLLPQFRKGPAPDSDVLKQARMWIEPRKPSVFSALVEKAMSFVSERWDIETLREGGVTAAENETSVVLYGHFDGSGVLLTADAGINALTWACNYAESQGIDLKKLSLIQVPHHGSRNNVSPSILNRLIGIPQGKDAPGKMTAAVSVPKDDENHPRRVVMNAFRRRGAPVSKTQGAKFRFYSGLPRRQNYSDAEPFPFFERVEDYV